MIFIYCLLNIIIKKTLFLDPSYTRKVFYMYFYTLKILHYYKLQIKK